MAEKMYLFQVDHPEYGTTTTTAKDDGGAVIEATNTWGVVFREIAGYCKVTKLGSALRPRCKRCHGEYGQPGDPSAYSPQGGRPIRSAPLSRTAGLCPACLEAVDRQRREAERYARGARVREKRLREMEE